jgi:hypothetical protein
MCYGSEAMSLFLRRLLDMGRRLFRRARTQPHKACPAMRSRSLSSVGPPGAGPVRALNEAEFRDFMAELERWPGTR